MDERKRVKRAWNILYCSASALMAVASALLLAQALDPGPARDVLPLLLGIAITIAAGLGEDRVAAFANVPIFDTKPEADNDNPPQHSSTGD